MTQFCSVKIYKFNKTHTQRERERERESLEHDDAADEGDPESGAEGGGVAEKMS